MANDCSNPHLDMVRRSQWGLRMTIAPGVMRRLTFICMIWPAPMLLMHQMDQRLNVRGMTATSSEQARQMMSTALYECKIAVSMPRARRKYRHRMLTCSSYEFEEGEGTASRSATSLIAFANAVLRVAGSSGLFNAARIVRQGQNTPAKRAWRP